MKKLKERTKKYPRINEKLDRRKKLMELDKKDIRELRNAGYKIPELAKRFKVSITTIRRVIYPEEQKKMYNRTAQRNFIRRLTDENFKSKMNKQIKEAQKTRRYLKEYRPLWLKYHRYCQSQEDYLKKKREYRKFKKEKERYMKKEIDEVSNGK